MDTKDYTLQTAETVGTASTGTTVTPMSVEDNTQELLSSKFVGTAEYVVQEEKEVISGGTSGSGQVLP